MTLRADGRRSARIPSSGDAASALSGLRVTRAQLLRSLYTTRLIMILRCIHVLGGRLSSASRYSGFEAAFNVTDREREHTGKRRVE